MTYEITPVLRYLFHKYYLGIQLMIIQQIFKELVLIKYLTNWY